MKKQLLSIACAAAFAGGVSNAAPIVQQFSCNDTVCGASGGIITFSEISDNRLQITIDNTTDGSTDLDPGPAEYFNSSAITGFVFNIAQDIQSAVVLSFVDGSNNPISGWTLVLDADSSITPGSTTFGLTWASGSINNGIYNAASPGSNIDNVVPDIATLIIQINDPVDWVLEGVGDDSILRMQRVGLNGRSSLKIPSSSTGGPPFEIPEPGPLSLTLLGVGLLGASLWSRRRSMQS